MATIAVFLALGGGAYAVSLGKNSVKSRNIAKNAVHASDIKRNAVRSSEIKNQQVRSADIGNGQVNSADIADGQVGIADAANSLRLNCPGGTLFVEGACLETAARGSGNLTTAIVTCRDLGRRLPSLSELQAARDEPGIDLTPGGNWADGGYGGQGTAVNDSGNELGFGVSSTVAFRCVTTTLR